MAKVDYDAPVDQFRGRIGPFIFQGHGVQKTVRRFGEPSGPPSEDQIALRAWFKACSDVWAILDANYVARVPYTYPYNLNGKTGRIRFMTDSLPGFNATASRIEAMQLQPASDLLGIVANISTRFIGGGGTLEFYGTGNGREYDLWSMDGLNAVLWLESTIGTVPQTVLEVRQSQSNNPTGNWSFEVANIPNGQWRISVATRWRLKTAPRPYPASMTQTSRPITRSVTVT